MKSKKVWTKEEAPAHVAANIAVNHETGCHEWQRSRTKDGYGQIGSSTLYDSFGIKLAHRLVVYLFSGHEFASRHEQVMHECHNRCCVNPLHLKIGTALENMQAAKARGSFHSKAGMVGEDNPRAVLKMWQVRRIKEMLAHGLRNCVIAQRLGISPNLVAQIKNGRSWAHVTI